MNKDAIVLSIQSSPAIRTLVEKSVLLSHIHCISVLLEFSKDDMIDAIDAIRESKWEGNLSLDERFRTLVPEVHWEGWQTGCCGLIGDLKGRMEALAKMGGYNIATTLINDLIPHLKPDQKENKENLKKLLAELVAQL